MSDAVIVALVTLAGTIISVLVSARNEREKSKNELARQLYDFKRISDSSDERINRKIDAVEEKLTAHIKQEQINDIKQRRARIIRCAEDLAEGRRFGKEYIEDILEDIDCYELWCSHHPDYKNGKGKAAMRMIQEYYLLKIMEVNHADERQSL